LKKIALRYILTGGCFNKFATYQNFEAQKLTKEEWGTLQHRIFQKITAEAEAHLKRRRERFRGNTIPILSVDCRWATKGFNANEATVTGFTSDGELLIVVNLYRTGPHKNCDYDAKGMEGYGVQHLCERLQEEQISVGKLLHDADASSWSNAQEVFPDLVELLCCNHAAKSLGFVLSFLFFFFLPFSLSFSFTFSLF
jgi:hypothetical protein